MNPKIVLVLSTALASSAGCVPNAGAPLAEQASTAAPYEEMTDTLVPTARKETVVAETAAGIFTLTSPDVREGGTLPVEYTCDGAAATLPLAWSGAPAGTRNYAIVMHHVAAPEDVHWYWVLFDIPPEVTSLAKNSRGIGTLGTNSVNGKAEYAPPCSKGPGPKTYVYTVYALSAQPKFAAPPEKIDRDALLEAIRNITLASAELRVTYTRE